MSTREGNLRLNFDLGDFHLNDDEMAQIDTLMEEDDRIVDSTLMPTAPQWD